MIRRAPTVSLKEHLEALLIEKDKRDQQRFAAQGEALTAALLAQEKAVATAMTAAEKAVTKAETANEKRFEAVNEFRATLSDQASTFPSRVELAALAQRVTDLATRMDKTEGRGAGASALYGWLLAAAAVVVAVVSLVTR